MAVKVIAQLFFTCSFSFVKNLAHLLSFVNLLFSYSFVSYNLPQIMLPTDPEIESSLLISRMSKSSKIPAELYIQSLLFHPKQEDWILGIQPRPKGECDHLARDSGAWLS